MRHVYSSFEIPMSSCFFVSDTLPPPCTVVLQFEPDAVRRVDGLLLACRWLVRDLIANTRTRAQKRKVQLRNTTRSVICAAKSGVTCGKRSQTRSQFHTYVSFHTKHALLLSHNTRCVPASTPTDDALHQQIYDMTKCPDKLPRKHISKLENVVRFLSCWVFSIPSARTLHTSTHRYHFQRA